MMQVAWNLLWLRPGVVGGSEEYATRQLRALVDHAAGDVRVTAFVLEPFLAAHPDLAARVRCIAVPLHGQAKPVRVGAENTWLAARTARGFDVVHHVGGRIPTFASAPRVLTVHDLQPLEHPENFSAVKRRFLARAIPRSVRRAQVVLTPSEHVRRRVLARFSLDPALVRAVAAPVLPARPPDTAPVWPADLEELAGAGHPYFVYPAITYAHKNHLVLLDAFAATLRDRPDARLVLSGGAGGTDAVVAERIARPDLAGRVIRPGRVPRDVLDALVAGATALVFPSRFEGFGLPVVEAIAAGCPVIAADIDALREVVAADGVLVDPDDPAAWAVALSRALDAAPRRGLLDAPGDPAARVAAAYAPARIASALVSAYRDAAGS